MKKFNVFLLALVTLLLSATAQAQVSQGQARNYQIDETHTGYAEAPGLTPPLKQKWAVNFGKSISYPLIADGRVFVTVGIAAGSGTTLYGLDAESGSTLWSFSLGAYSQWSALCYENGRVFAINGDGLLRAFDGATGSVIWSRQLPGQYSFSSAPTVFQGVIYTGGAGSGGTAYAVSADTGTVLWTASVANGDNSSPAITADAVYLSYACPNVYKLNRTNGALIWRYNPGCSGGGGKTPVFYNGRLYVRDYSPDYIFDSQTGGIAGSFVSKSAPAFSGNMGFFMNGPKYFGSFGTLEGRNINTNSVVWSFTGDGFLQSSMLAVNQYVYVGSDQGKLYALKADTGQQVWSTNVGMGIPYVDEHNVSQPLTGFAAGEGILVIPTKTTLVAYEADPAPTLIWGDKTPAANASGWNTSAVEISFTASARTPGGVTFSTPGSPIQFGSEGRNQTQQVTVSDEAGNTANYTSPTVNIDRTAPVTTKTIAGTTGNDGWYTSAAQVSLNASDPLSGIRNIYYQVDGGATQTYVGAFSISAEGSHAVSYWSVDVAGNTESQHSFGLLVDVNAPSTQASVSGTPNGSGWYRDHQITLTASDTSSGVANTYYTVDGGTTQTYSGPFSVSSDGNHVINYWSVDVAGKAEIPRTLYFKTDNSAPNTDLSSTGTNGWNLWRTSAVQVTLWPSDGRSGVAATYYTVDGGATQTYTGPFTVDGNGQHPISFWSVDNVGNTEVQKSSTVKIDKDGPTVETAVSGPAGNNNYFTGAVQVSLTATDNVAGMAYTTYQIDSGPLKNYSSPFSVTGDGTHAVKVWSTDMAGNVSASTTGLNIDSMAPLTQPTLSGTAGANGWYGTAVQVTLGAADNTSGIADTYYSIDGGLQQSYSTPFTISNTGTHTILYWSVDRANNAESPHSMSIKVDVNAPSTQATVSGTPATAGTQIQRRFR